jgi:streptolysin S family bacteriocin protoxin
LFPNRLYSTPQYYNTIILIVWHTCCCCCCCCCLESQQEGSWRAKEINDIRICWKKKTSRPSSIFYFIIIHYYCYYYNRSLHLIYPTRQFVFGFVVFFFATVCQLCIKISIMLSSVFVLLALASVAFATDCFKFTGKFSKSTTVQLGDQLLVSYSARYCTTIDACFIVSPSFLLFSTIFE